MQPSERWLARVWQEQWLERQLATTDGTPLRVVYRGVWSQRHGPDFADALIDLAGVLLSGDVELHVRASDWYAHGHHEDPAYDTVVLHVVWQDDLRKPVTRRDGHAIPTLELRRVLAFPDHLAPTTPRPLGALGFQHCAPELATSAPERLQRLLEEAGDARLQGKVDGVRAHFALEPPAQTLYWLLADALGFHRNREGMRTVAQRLPLERLEGVLRTVPAHHRFPAAAALLLGTAGFLPLSDHERTFAPLDRSTWRTVESLWYELGPQALSSPPSWNTGGTRPANHPVRRLASLATLTASAPKGILHQLADCLRSQHPRVSLTAWLRSAPVPVGADRAHEIIVNVVVPFALAYAQATGEESLETAAAELWRSLPAGRGNALTRATLEQICGPSPFRVRSARAEQGLLHLYKTGCQPRQCHTCPIAHLVLTGSTSPPTRSCSDETL